jgi:outer membrane receptor protein involved in Fe transport
VFGDGAWTFPSLTAFLQNQPSLFLGALPGATDAARNIEEWRIASYVQDEWRLANRVTLNLGLVRPAIDSHARQERRLW